MKFQDDPQLGPYINAWGCDFCSLLALVEVKSNGTFTWDYPGILEVYKQGMDHGYVQKEVQNPDGSPADGCTILDFTSFFALASQYAKVLVVCGGEFYAEHDYQPTGNDAEILELKRDGHAGSHFTLGNGKANQTPWQNEIAFDPIRGGSQTAKLGWIASKRILQFA